MAVAYNDHAVIMSTSFAINMDEVHTEIKIHIKNTHTHTNTHEFKANRKYQHSQETRLFLRGHHV